MEEIMSSSKDASSEPKEQFPKDTPHSVNMNINDDFELNEVSIKPSLKKRNKNDLL
jgi:hypothetical protein